MFWRKKLKDEIRSLELERTGLKLEKDDWRKDVIQNQEFRQHNAELTQEINKLKKQVRSQTEADLFFISTKIISELLQDKSKEEVKTLLQQQADLRSRLAAQQAAGPPSYSPSYSQSALLGSLFGGRGQWPY